MWLYALDDLVVHVCPADHFLPLGVPLQTYENYLATPEGLAAVKSASTTALVRAKSSFYIPAGYVSFIVHYKAVDKKGNHKTSDETYAYAIATPLPFVKKLQELDKGVASAFLRWHHDATKEKPKTGMWGHRAEFLDAILSPPAPQ